jgi:hypothetical protein
MVTLSRVVHLVLARERNVYIYIDHQIEWCTIGLWEKVELVVNNTNTVSAAIFTLLQQLDEQQALAEHL